MRHRVKKTTLGREKAPRKALIKSLSVALVLYEKITTTEAKAKALKPIIEKLVTKARKNDLATKRQLESALGDKKAVRKLLDIYGPLYKERKGGYTRITKLDPRRGDGAKIAQIEFVK